MTTELTADLLRANPLPQPNAGSKDERGRVLLVAGALEVPGAALLAGTAAFRAGAGKVQVATVRSAAQHLGMALPEALVMGLAETSGGDMEPEAAIGKLTPKVERLDALSIGIGMMESRSTSALAAALCKAATCPVAIDAGALSALRDDPASFQGCAGRAVLTPHAGEMAQLLKRDREEIEADPLVAAREAQRLLRSTVVMKGAQTHILSPDGDAWLFTGGGVGLATSGSGDVLGGLIAGLLARGADPTLAALWGVFLHGEAGRRLGEREGPLGFLARDLAAEAPGIMRDLGGSERPT